MVTTTSTGDMRPARRLGPWQHPRALLGALTDGWQRRSLAFQFLAAGGLVSLCAMFLVGLVVTSLIERAVTRNAAATTALYVDSVIAPLLPDMKTNQVLDETVRRALDETLGQGALGDRLVAMRLWAPDGTILYSDEPALIGRRLAPSASVRQALAGELVARYGDVAGPHLDRHVASGPLLGIYNPILQPWSGDVVAVIEFYEVAHEFQAALNGARLRSWLAVAAVTILFFLLLSAIVLRGSRTIDRQAGDLGRRVAELMRLLERNRALHLRVQAATQRATALNENYLRRLGADLHDGPAQLVALASLQLDGEAVLGADVAPERREREIASIRASLDDALGELRGICHGLVLPQIDTATLREVIEHAIDAYERRTGSRVKRRLHADAVSMPLSERICIYRFLQEALNNGYRHCRGAPQSVTASTEGDELVVTVSDRGPGFDPAAVPKDSIGLAAMRERVESLGGRFHLDTSPHGTSLTVTLATQRPAA